MTQRRTCAYCRKVIAFLLDDDEHLPTWMATAETCPHHTEEGHCAEHCSTEGI